MSTLYVCAKIRRFFAPGGRFRASSACFVLCATVLAVGNSSAAEQDIGPTPSRTQHSANSQVNKDAEAEAELERALADAGNDSAAMVRNLKNYLQKFPDS